MSELENAERHAQLVAAVAGLGLRHKMAVGKSADSDWQEESLIIFDLDLKQALKIGRQFVQHAILFGEADKVALVWCESGDLDWYYPQILTA